ncbi:hypothetical protein HU200_048774 [Digitaria exilis]|uniref:Protein kinase domain-containing protein n=1 Tax=Digitaria exilis TaxID=1010633 RepID=A0A835E8Y4_9POAL|nr:hypothetical protein HU200_048774 [Digitaria exilis]
MLSILTYILLVTPSSLSTSHSDFLALLSIKSHITSDPRQALSSWDGARNDTNTPVPDFCQWNGVTCGGRRYPGHVTAINLQGYGLSGTISQDIGNLTYLHFLDLSSNNLVGDIPSTLGNCRKLYTVNLNDNHFSGSVPSPLGHLSKLTIFDVGHNNLTGEIPTTLLNITTLTFLRIEGNSFSGQIRSWLSNLTSLTDLFLASNNFSGNIPADLCRLTNLVRFDVMDNKLDGLVPPSLFNFSSINVLNLGFNQLAGSLPPDIGFKLPRLSVLGTEENHHFRGLIPASLTNASQLTYLLLRGNQYHGVIPPDIGTHGKLILLSVGYNELQATKPTEWDFLTSLSNCSSLGILDLEGNKFAGFLPIRTPSWIRRFHKLTKLILADNQFTGTLPEDIGRLSSLQFLDLSQNRFEGQIPQSLGNITELTSLSLSRNLLQGQIPRGLNSLGVLEKLDLSSNNLTGPIPEFLGSIITLNYLNLSFNNLSGPVPDTGVFCNSSILSVTGNSMLCGGPQFLHLPPCPSIRSHKASRNRLHIFIFCAIGTLIFCLCSIAIYCFINRMITPNFVGREYLFLNRNHERVSYAQLHEATKSFSPANLIGSGSSGKVYIGNLILDKNLATVAIKVLNLEQQGANRSFLAECNVLKSIRHRKLVKVITVCSGMDPNGDEFKALVLEYICNGNLDEWLHPNTMTDSMISRRLSLMRRLHIALDVAEALDYLHYHIDPPIVHCDIKPSNILLDDNFVAHVTDFGLAKIMQSEACKKNHPEIEGSSFAVNGTIGYVPPGK